MYQNKMHLMVKWKMGLHFIGKNERKKCVGQLFFFAKVQNLDI